VILHDLFRQPDVVAMELEFLNKARLAGSFVVRQSEYFLAIVMLKIRIIGFANKRSDLFARLGRVVYSSGVHPKEGETGSRSLIEDIKEADREIREAEEAIIEVKEKARNDRAQFFADRKGEDNQAAKKNGREK